MELDNTKKNTENANFKKSFKKRKNKPLPLSNVMNPNKNSNILKAAFSHTIGGILRYALHNGGSSNYIFKIEEIKKIRLEAAKLHSQGVMDFISLENILEIFSIFENIIKKGKNIVINSLKDERDVQNMVASDKEKVLVAIEASLTSLYISSSNIDSRIYLEDLLEEVISFSTYLIKNWINPTFKDTKSKNARKGKTFFVTLSHNASEILKLLSEVIQLKKFTDNVILDATSLGISSLFTDRCDLQLSSVKLFVAIFSFYDQHRKLIFEDIFSHLKDHNFLFYLYKLNSGEDISLFTALSLLLIQCTVSCPLNSNRGERTQIQLETHILEIYKTAKIITYDFLCDFMNRAITEIKAYRSLFSTFLQDLLLLLNKPEWPTSEFVLTVLCELAIFQHTRTSNISLRLISLECLCAISAAIKKDMVETNSLALDNILNNNNNVIDKQSDHLVVNEDKLFFLQQTLSNFLLIQSQHNSLYVEARMFYLVSFYKKCHYKLNKVLSEVLKETNNDLIRFLTHKEQLLKNQIINVTPDNSTKVSKYIDEESIREVVKHLNFQDKLYSNFKIYFDYIINSLTDNTMSIRKKALKGISSVLEVDPSILSMEKIQLAVRNSFLDSYPLVRETAIDMIGKFIILKPEVFPLFYIHLHTRILDTSITVRKKVIKIFMDICNQHSDLPQLSELLFKIACRLNDEESVQNMVKDFFQKFWFTPVSNVDPLEENKALERKVLSMVNCIEMTGEANVPFFEKVFLHIFKGENDKSTIKSSVSLTTSCQQIVNCLIETLIKFENAGTDSKNLLSCMILINLVSKYQPNVLEPHISTIHPYLSINCSSIEDHKIVNYVALTLEEIVPQIKHPNLLLYIQLEEDFLKLLMKQEKRIVVSSIKCLVQILKKTKHYNLVYDCFNFCHNFIINVKEMFADKNSNSSKLSQMKQSVNRAVFIIGLLVQQFDLNDTQIFKIKPNNSFQYDLVEIMLYFFNKEIDTQLCVLNSIGFICTRYSDLLLKDNIKSLFIQHLSIENVNIQNKVQILKNLECFLIEEDKKFSIQNNINPTVLNKKHIKEFAEIYLGMASTVIQNYLQNVLVCLFDINIVVRKEAMEIIRLVLVQGLMDPCQIVSHVICLCTDEEAHIRKMAEKLILEVEEKYPGYTHINAQKGMKLSFIFQKGLVRDNIIRGYRLLELQGHPTAKNSLLYSTLKTKQQRRNFLSSLIKQFDENSKIDLEEMLYIADNLVYFPYLVLDEPLYLIHQINIILSFSGTTLVQMFDENLTPTDAHVHEDDGLDGNEEIANEESIIARLPSDTTQLWHIIKAARGCILLSLVKQHIRNTYNIKFCKMNEYSPITVNKTYNKNLSFKVQPCFTPKSIIEKLTIEKHFLDNVLLVREYLEIKKLINSLDFEGLRKNINSESTQGSPIFSSQRPSLSNANFTIDTMDQLPNNSESNETPVKITDKWIIDITPLTTNTNMPDETPDKIADKITTPKTSSKPRTKVGNKRQCLVSLGSVSPKDSNKSDETPYKIADGRATQITSSNIAKAKVGNKRLSLRSDFLKNSNMPDETPDEIADGRVTAITSSNKPRTKVGIKRLSLSNDSPEDSNMPHETPDKIADKTTTPQTSSKPRTKEGNKMLSLGSDSPRDSNMSDDTPDKIADGRATPIISSNIAKSKEGIKRLSLGKDSLKNSIMPDETPGKIGDRTTPITLSKKSKVKVGIERLFLGNDSPKDSNMPHEPPNEIADGKATPITSSNKPKAKVGIKRLSLSSYSPKDRNSPDETPDEIADRRTTSITHNKPKSKIGYKRLCLRSYSPKNTNVLDKILDKITDERTTPISSNKPSAKISNKKVHEITSETQFPINLSNQTPKKPCPIINERKQKILKFDLDECD